MSSLHNEKYGQVYEAGPNKRTNTLLKFSEKFSGTKKISEELKGWNPQFSQDLLKFRAIIFKPETILGSKQSKASYQLKNADWESCFCKWTCVTAPSCQRWVVIYSPKDYAAVKKKCCLEKSILSQCVTGIVLNKFNSKLGGLMSMATKAAIQKNCNWEENLGLWWTPT